MNIIIGNAPFVKKDPEQGHIPAGENRKKHISVERRKNREDRRKSNRDGIFVSISTINDRRKQRDRRTGN